jgi:multidrug transporter EmrE-like cation transporter
MVGLPFRVIATFGAALVFQLVAVGLVPRTRGFTSPLASIACMVFFVASLWMISRLVYNGVGLGILTSFMAATVPLGAITIGTLLYGEAASLPKAAALAGACILVGVASRMP